MPEPLRPNCPGGHPQRRTLAGRLVCPTCQDQRERAYNEARRAGRPRTFGQGYVDLTPSEIEARIQQAEARVRWERRQGIRPGIDPWQQAPGASSLPARVTPPRRS